MWLACSSIEADVWVDAQGMPGAQVAPVDYRPAGWPEDTIVRRVRVDVEAISADPRSRRRRTIDPDQLALALEGTATHAYAVSFIVTNIPANNAGARGETILDVGAWFRRRPASPSLWRQERQHHVDVGSVAGREPLGPPPGPVITLI